MKKVGYFVLAMTVLFGIAGTVWTDESYLLKEVKLIQEGISDITAKYEVAVRQANQIQVVSEPKVVLASFGCTPEPEKPKPEPELKEVPQIVPFTPSKPITNERWRLKFPEAKKPAVKKPAVKKPAVSKVTRNGNVWTIKLNTSKLQKGYEVHLCVGYLYFPVSADQIRSDGTVQITTDWLPPGNPRVSAGVWNGNGHYVTSMLVTG